MRVLTNFAVFLAGLCSGMIFSIPPDLIGLAALGGVIFTVLALAFQVGAIWVEEMSHA